MAMTIAQALQWVKEYNFDSKCALQLLQDSESAGEHPHEHIIDWTDDGSHIDGSDRDRGAVEIKNGMLKSDSTTTWTLEQACTALVFVLNSPAGEAALTILAGVAPGGRVAIQSRSGAWASSHYAQERWATVFDTTFTKIDTEGVTVVLKNSGGNVILVTFFPRESFSANEKPSADKDLVIAPGNVRTEYPATDYSVSSYKSRASRWFRGSYNWAMHRAGIA